MNITSKALAVAFAVISLMAPVFVIPTAPAIADVVPPTAAMSSTPTADLTVGPIPPAATGEQVILTATYVLKNPDTPVPVGTKVTFKNGDEELGTVTARNGGARLPYTFVTAGIKNITAHTGTVSVAGHTYPEKNSAPVSVDITPRQEEEMPEPRIPEGRCYVDHSWINSDKQDALVDPDGFRVISPKTVYSGQPFTVVIRPNIWTSNGIPIGRMKYDLTLPEGITVLGYKLTDQGENIQAMNGDLQVDRIGANGYSSPTGGFLRISAGNYTISNGPHSNDTDSSQYGLANVDTDATFRLPGVAVTFQAPNEVGKTVSMGLRGAGEGAAKQDNNTISLLEVDVGTWSRHVDGIYCNASDGGKEIFTTTVVEPDNTVTTLVASDDIILEPGYDIDDQLTKNLTATLTATVTLPDGSHPRAGTVTFKDATTQEVIDSPVALDASKNGVAQVTKVYSNNQTSTDITHSINVEYTGVKNTYSDSSATIHITVKPEPVAKDTTITFTEQSTNRLGFAGGEAPIILRLTDMNQNPVTYGSVALLEDGNEVERKKLTESNQAVDFTFTRTYPANSTGHEKTHTFTAKYTGGVKRFNDSNTTTQHTLTIGTKPVKHLALAITANPIANVHVDDKVHVTVTATAAGDPVTGRDVIIRVNGVRQEVQPTNDNGTVTWIFTPKQHGDVTLTAAIRGYDSLDVTYLAAQILPSDSGAVTFTVLPKPSDPSGGSTPETHNYTLEMEADTTNPKVGDQVTLTATLKDNEQPVTTLPVSDLWTVTFQSADKDLATRPLDSNGTATFIYRVPDTRSITMHATFNGVHSGDVQIEDVTTDKGQEVEIIPMAREVAKPEPKPEAPVTSVEEKPAPKKDPFAAYKVYVPLTIAAAVIAGWGATALLIGPTISPTIAYNEAAVANGLLRRGVPLTLAGFLAGMGRTTPAIRNFLRGLSY